MATIFSALLDGLQRDPSVTLYLMQAATYYCASVACRCGLHAPWQVYGVSACVHGALAAVHVLAH